MLYEKYERRVRRKVSIFRQIYKYRILLITLASIAFFSMSAYSVSKGTVYNVSIPDSFVYSEQVNFSSDALFSTVSYSYRIKGETTWLDEMPTIAGEYEVQIQSKQMFGRTKSQIKDFTINPKNIVLNLEESTIVFGDNPVFKADLAQNDYIDDAQFTFDDISQSTTRLNLQSIIIRNSAGVDVTSSYRYETVELPINFTARPITVTLLDISAIYDGNILRSDEIEITKGSLVEGHLIEVSSLGEQLSVGNSLNTI